ncbi:heat-inducible transcriptional repressor HrcA [Bifidobacterium samirii]|uniref:Heat-inducible transcription repressor HrcA n=1 Tax=Bifidobacterium samirii TaxID=2306974 RepID=A0A430FJB7_9BIFI|nr:heat-inducible transcriptional repressor HrcA [Bifidobacterium samirii]RSX52969.1 HrcA family transcriptional regulator [Bifidobacterium samirii]
MTGNRRMLVLRAVVEDYIRSHEPIGSTALARRHDLGVSSATIRNDMAALEDEGYLTQPHTSAGRIPTEKGYRYFVDRLSTVMPMSPAQRSGIAAFLSGSVSLQDTLRRAARILSSITGQVAVVASPSLSKATLRHVELVPVASMALLAVVITDTGRVAQHTIGVRRMPAPDALAALGEAVNARCGGRPLTAAADLVRTLARDPRWQGHAALCESLADAFDGMADDEMAGELYVAGASRLAYQGSPDDLAPLFDALEEQVVIMRLMSELSAEHGAAGAGVAIGSETHTPGLMHASVVAGGYGNASETGDGTTDAGDGATASPVAFVGSIGPTHMDYAATIAAVRAVARYLTATVAAGGADTAEG